MSRKPRFYQKTNYFHVMVQGINKNYIFQNPKDKKYYIKVIKEKVQDYNLKILTCCIMDNHVHFVIYTEIIDELSEFMRKINSMYATYYNRKYERVGYVFRDRFKSQSIFSEKQLYRCIKYVYNNPVKAGMCKSPKEYPYLDYKECYDIECNVNEDYFIDIDDEDESDESIIRNYIIANNLNIYKKVDDLKKLISYLRIRNMSYRRIEKVISISRRKLSKLII